MDLPDEVFDVVWADRFVLSLQKGGIVMIVCDIDDVVKRGSIPAWVFSKGTEEGGASLMPAAPKWKLKPTPHFMKLYKAMEDHKMPLSIATYSHKTEKQLKPFKEDEEEQAIIKALFDEAGIKVEKVVAMVST